LSASLKRFLREENAAYRLTAVSRGEQEKGKKTKPGIRSGSDVRGSKPFFGGCFWQRTAILLSHARDRKEFITNIRFTLAYTGSE
jgi:hypothetical protein